MASEQNSEGQTSKNIKLRHVMVSSVAEMEFRPDEVPASSARDDSSQARPDHMQE